jgi:hypothetical protein
MWTNRIHRGNRITLASLWFCILAMTSPAMTQNAAGVSGTETSAAVLSLYREFAAAQNARDRAAIRRTFLDSPRFLWISDGMAVWGPDVVLDRMGLFQQSEVWRVEPDFGKADVVALTADSAMLHLPLALVIGKAAAPDRLRFLVEVICVRTPDGWRIAALLTTNDKSAG